MDLEEVLNRSPLRILAQSIHGGLGKGHLGVIMARAGVGKTACLVQICLNELLRERTVLHITLEHTIDHVQSWYDALLQDLADRSELANRETVHAMMTRNRMIASFSDGQLDVGRLKETVDSLKGNIGFSPQILSIDGFNWNTLPPAQILAVVESFKAYARELEMELWMSAQTHRELTGDHPTRVPPPCDSAADVIDVALFLEPHGDAIALRLLQSHDNTDPDDETHIHLHPDTLRLTSDDEPRRELKLPSSAYTLLSGGAKGAEAAFGACAERWGLEEMNFTFEGRPVERKRGLVTLNEAELAQGDVSPKYLAAHMHRTYPEREALKKVLQSIWHQVNTAGEVFTVGEIQSDKTVKGGTGWATELARLWHKPAHVYDQTKQGWFTWQDHDWVAVKDPVIRCRRFSGTGTRTLESSGRRAIEALFARSFGQG